MEDNRLTSPEVFKKRIEDILEYALIAPEEELASLTEYHKNLLLCAIARKVEEIETALRFRE